MAHYDLPIKPRMTPEEGNRAMNAALTGVVATTELARMRLLHDNVLLKVVGREDEEKVSAGGIVMPATAKKQERQRGVVIAVGPGKLRPVGMPDNKTVKWVKGAMHVQPGDTVFFEYASGSLLQIDGQEYLMLVDDQITGIIEADDAGIMAAAAGGLT